MTRIILLLGLVAAGPLAPVSPASSQSPRLSGDLRWRNIGPANMSGRITDIEAVERDPAIVYAAAASGGLWKSVNAGTTWSQIFGDYGTANMGDIAIFQPNPDIIWVGTGESCVRNSVGWGDGVYKSTDGGKTFTNVGLRGSHHISQVVTHPSNPDLVYVASQGHLWGDTGERGLFRTRDGGRTWQLLSRGLPRNGAVGASDLVMDPANPNVLYAAFWNRLREPHRFTSGGPDGGIYRSADGGDSWTRLSNGLPDGPTGKIGLAMTRAGPGVIMAIVEHGFQPARNSADWRDMTKLGSGIYRSENHGASWTYVNRFNNRPFYYSHIYLDPADANRLYVLATTAIISTDGGRTFSGEMEGIAGDFHALWIDPANSNRYYVGNDKGAYVTYDRGAHFQMFDNMDLGQFYSVSVDNREPYWVYGGLQDNGNWGGPSNSRDQNGILTDHWFKFHAGDGFHTTVDPTDWRTVYTEAQGGRIRRLDAVFRQVGRDITPNVATTLNLKDIVPAVTAAAGALPRSAFRFNWSTPFILSPHDPRTIYYAGNYLFRSPDRGDTWTIISGDLSTGNPDFTTTPGNGGLTPEGSGAETHATAITIAESPLAAGTIWVGTDDGNVQLTRDGGGSWVNVRASIPGVPAHTWVSRIEASRTGPGTAYVTFDGHRRDDFKPYVFRTTDYGRTWTSLAGNLPADAPVYVIREDPVNPRVLFVGTERSALVSRNGGERWKPVGSGLPTVPVYDLVIHPRDGDLIAATHGRSIWILDNIDPLRQMTDEVLAGDVHLFTPRTATRWHGVTRGGTRGHFLFQGRNPLTITQAEPANSPLDLENGAAIDFHLKAAGPATLVIEDLAGRNRYQAALRGQAGLNRHIWKLRFDPAGTTPTAEASDDEEGGPAAARRRRGAEAGPGTYRVTLTAAGRTTTTTVTVRADPALGPTGAP